ncbi:MAG: hypothetical protein SOR61_04365 [Evtepia sp.]|uniref:hypothetical protein n=1 Tax=Evtepia sp. TaxID=2773933 RepID=UPI002A76028B|nr:hypothetical protein [Evtepia sp.]MDY3014416.1 hypothetical protein [Evtepia sp.]
MPAYPAVLHTVFATGWPFTVLLFLFPLLIGTVVARPIFKTKVRLVLGVLFLIGYAVCEVLATFVFHTTQETMTAIAFGGLCLGLSAAFFVVSGIIVLARRLSHPADTP